MIFIPYGVMNLTPDDFQMSYEDVYININENEQIHGWYIPSHNAQKTLLFFHGNAGNISHRLESIKIFHNLGLNVFIVDYRGYGKSKGNPSEKRMYEDAEFAWNFLISEKGLQPEQLIFFGRSMGGAVANHLATEKQPQALILESSFSSFKDMAHQVLPFLSSLVYLRFDFDNVSTIQKYHQSVLILHSPDDEIIPFQQSKKIFQAANQPKQFIELTGDHNSGFLQSQPGYQQYLAEFISTLN